MAIVEGDPFQDLGRFLRQHREKAGLSLTQVQNMTKIRMRYLEALEEGQFDVIPGEVYLKGFLKLYAQTVGLDPSHVLGLYDETMASLGLTCTEPPAVHSTISMEVPTLRPRPRWVMPVVVLVVFLIGYAIFAPMTGDHTPTTPLDNVPAEPGVEEQAGAAQGVAGNEVVVEPPVMVDPQVPLSGEMDPSASGEMDQPAQVTPEVPGEASAEVSPGVPAQTQVQVNLDLNVRERCWVEVFSDGERVASRVLEAGEEATFTAGESIVIKFGNPSGVDLVLNGVPLGAAGFGVVTRNFDTALVNRVLSEGAGFYKQMVAEETRRLQERRLEALRQRENQSAGTEAESGGGTTPLGPGVGQSQPAETATEEDRSEAGE